MKTTKQPPKSNMKEGESCSVVSYSLQPHRILQARKLKWVAFPFSRGIFPTQGLNLDLPLCRWILYQLSHEGNPRILEWVAYPFSSGSSWPRNQTRVSHIAGGFFSSWATRESAIVSVKILHSSYRWCYRKYLITEEVHNLKWLSQLIKQDVQCDFQFIKCFPVCVLTYRKKARRIYSKTMTTFR